MNLALGATDTTSEINIAGISESSSFFDMLPAHLHAAPTSKYVGKERVTARRLDSLFSEICSANDRILLKIDTQGYEKTSWTEQTDLCGTSRWFNSKCL
ncbi:MAG: FkbM family methyltransferase [Verrucomicrobiia bacterium]